MADTPENVKKQIEAKLKAASANLEVVKIDAAIKEAKALKGDKDMPD